MESEKQPQTIVVHNRVYKPQEVGHAKINNEGRGNVTIVIEKEEETEPTSPDSSETETNSGS